jgi:Cu2+-exporting ATPase
MEHSCYHCGLPLIPGIDYKTIILGETRDMCCPGCKAVAEAIVSSGLADYYKYRTEKASKGDADLSQTMINLKAYDQQEIQQEFVVEQDAEQVIQLTIEGISCAACGWLIESQVNRLDGVNRIAVNVAARRATLTWTKERIQLSEIMLKIEQIGYHALPFQQDKHEASYKTENKRYLKRLGLAGLMTMQVMMLAIALYFDVFGDLDNQTKDYFHWLSFVLSTPVVFYSGSQFYSSAFYGMKSRTINMDVSITLAVWGTYVASAWATIKQSGDIYFESVCMFIFLLLISRYLEHRSRHKAAQISANMLKYIPLSATLYLNGKTESCLAKKLEVGQQVLVNAGETIPLDCTIVSGESQIDESMLSGEFEPVSKTRGNKVFGGTINLTGSLILEVTATLKHALVNQIMRMQELALADKPKMAHYAEVASQKFVFIVVILAVGSFIAWQFIDSDRAFWIAIAVLVATCPCALSLATPSVLTSAMARLNRDGILVKRADILEQLNNIDTMVFDKTGTLTEGTFSITQVKSLVDDLSTEDILQIAASMEAHSEHPIANAFRKTGLLKVDNVQIEQGFGVEGQINGVYYQIGSARFVKLLSTAEYQWASVFVKRQDKLIGAIALTDKIKVEASSVLASLPCAERIILSGDCKANVLTVANELKIKQALWEKSPAQKLAMVRELQSSGRKVMMLGDGINDAPVLALASVSIAIGNAADMTKRSADIILLGNKLSGLPLLFDISQRAQIKVKQNMMWAIGYNLLVLPLAIFGVLTPWMAVIGMSASSVIVVSNSIRLLGYQRTV